MMLCVASSQCHAQAIKSEYDEVGSKISMKTSDKGEITYKYNCLGECVYTKDAVSVTQNTQYDELGRV